MFRPLFARLRRSHTGHPPRIITAMPYHWTVTYQGREIGRITSNRDDGPETALWLARETLGEVDPLDVRVESYITSPPASPMPVPAVVARAGRGLW